MSMKDYADTVLAAGFPAQDMDLMDIYLLAGRITRDKWLDDRAHQFLEGGNLTADAHFKALKACSGKELQELRARVSW